MLDWDQVLDLAKGPEDLVCSKAGGNLVSNGKSMGICCGHFRTHQLGKLGGQRAGASCYFSQYLSLPEPSELGRDQKVLWKL